ncbi:hypothetical protein HG531_008553 [Fusarium graminearum]|nr:hypothetical protein HG531_008553 [Fusarium graminearum]
MRGIGTHSLLSRTLADQSKFTVLAHDYDNFHVFRIVASVPWRKVRIKRDNSSLASKNGQALDTPKHPHIAITIVNSTSKDINMTTRRYPDINSAMVRPLIARLHDRSNHKLRPKEILVRLSIRLVSCGKLPVQRLHDGIISIRRVQISGVEIWNETMAEPKECLHDFCEFRSVQPGLFGSEQAHLGVKSHDG